MKKLELMCIIFKYILTFILLAISITISKDVLEQYASKAASFKQREEEVTEKEGITLVVGLWPLKKMDYAASIPYQSYDQWKLNQDFRLKFGVMNYKTAQDSIELKENTNELNIVHSGIGKVRFEKLIGHYGNYYMINANTINVKSPFWTFVNVQIEGNVENDDVPFVDIYVSSSKNVFGISMFNWLDGKRLTLTRNQGVYWVEIQPKKIIKMKSESKCGDISFYECFQDELAKQNYDNCPRKCFSISTFANLTPICETEEEFQCSHEITLRLKESTKCLPVCTQIDYDIEYEYQENLNKPNAKRNVTFGYRLSNTKMKVEEEYFLHDFVGMLGSIGGTLGLFLGFSFLGGLFFLLQHLQELIEIFKSKSLNKFGSGKEQNIIGVESKKNEEDIGYFDHEVVSELNKSDESITSLMDDKRRIQNLEKDMKIVLKSLENLKQMKVTK